MTGEDAQLRKTVLIFLILIFSFVIIKTAWVCDDSYITLRTVDNFVNGYGPVWNVGERVQSYTHPLWMLLISTFYAITKEDYFTLVGLSLLISIISFVILGFKISKNWMAVSAGLVILIISRSFIDYSTSGLDNPLSHLLFVIFAVVLFTKKNNSLIRIFFLGLIACLATLNRMDTALLYVPTLLYELILFRNRKAISVMALSFMPFIIWEIFSIIYYGFLFPNTAYAKLSTGISLVQYLRQGMIYFMNSIKVDPITLLIIGISLVLVFLNRNIREKMLGLGIVLYLFYVIYIGGDFMSGRFFSLPLLISVILLINYFESLPKTGVLVSITSIMIFFIINIISIPFSGSPMIIAMDGEPFIDVNGIADERAYYYPTAGLMNYNRLNHLPSHFWVSMGKALRRDRWDQVMVVDNTGFQGFFAGPQVFLVDRYGLSDPLIARIPITPKKDWRIGHFLRDLPSGYLKSLQSGINVISNPSLAEYYEKLKIITRDAIWNWDRFAVIWKMNTGQYNYLLM